MALKVITFKMEATCCLLLSKLNKRKQHRSSVVPNDIIATCFSRYLAGWLAGWLL